MKKLVSIVLAILLFATTMQSAFASNQDWTEGYTCPMAQALMDGDNTEHGLRRTITIQDLINHIRECDKKY